MKHPRSAAAPAPTGAGNLSASARLLSKSADSKSKPKRRTREEVRVEGLNHALRAVFPGHNVVGEGRDGNCMFRTIARHKFRDPELYDRVREEVLYYLSANRWRLLAHVIGDDLVGYTPRERAGGAGGMDLYFNRMRRDRQYGDMPTLMAAAELYGFTVFHYDINHGIVTGPNEYAPEGDNRALDPTHLHVLFQTDGGRGGHFDTIIPQAGPAFAEVANAAHARLDAMDAEMEGQEDASPAAGAVSPPATCVFCKQLVSSHSGKSCRPPKSPHSALIPGLDDADADATDVAPIALSAEPSDTEPAAAEPVAAPAVAEPVVEPVAEPAAEPAAEHLFPSQYPIPLPVQPAPLNININPHPENAPMDADSPNIPNVFSFFFSS